jgi:hypothetical protein
MSKQKKLTTLDIALKVEWEGLGDTIQHYFGNTDVFEDDDLADKWEQAKTLLDEIEETLNEAMKNANESDFDRNEEEER